MRRTGWLVTTLCLVLSAAPPAFADVMLEPDAPDTIVFVRNGDLWSVLPDGSELTQITDGPASDSDPAWHPWHPAGARLAFTRSTSTNKAVWIVSSEGDGAQRLIRNASDPAWSDYGDRIAFVRRTGGDLDVWVADEDGTNARALTASGGDDTHPTWAFGKIAFVSDRTDRRSIWVMNEQGRHERLLTDGSGWDTNPTWSDIEIGGALIYEHVQTTGDHDIRMVSLDKDVEPVYGARTDDRAPSATLGGWFSFIRRGMRTTIRTALIQSPSASDFVATSGPGLSNPAVTPFHTWVRAQDDQAKANLVAAADAAEAIYGETGSFEDAGYVDMATALPALNYRDGNGDSLIPTELSIETTTHEWSAAAISYSGYCYWIRIDASFEMLRLYDVVTSNSSCSGVDALSAVNTDGW